MQTVIHATLTGHATAFQLEEDAYRSLQAYFDRARTRLRRDPDHEEIIRDLEQSIAEKLVQLLRGENRVIRRHEVEAVLEQVGAVNAGNGEAPGSTSSTVPPAQRRRLCRVEEGKWFFGVCQGLSVYSSIAVEWVRALFVIVTVFTGGIPILIYLVLMFVLPVAQTRAEGSAGLYTQPGAL